MRSFAAVLGAAAGLAGCLAYRYRVFSSQNRAGPTVVRLRRLVAASAGAPQGALTVPPTAYPAVRRDESVVEELHGQLIADPYRWLEDPDSPETQAFVAAQNKLTSSVLEQCEAREPFKELFTGVWGVVRSKVHAWVGTLAMSVTLTALPALLCRAVQLRKVWDTL